MQNQAGGRGQEDREPIRKPIKANEDHIINGGDINLLIRASPNTRGIISTQHRNRIQRV